MTNTKIGKLGAALTHLKLENNFLSNGGLQSFPLVERGQIANGIISEKLSIGEWQDVVKMIYGGFGKADALYEGDPIDLKKRIVESALKHPDTLFRSDETVKTLAAKKEFDLLYDLFASVPIGYKEIDSILKLFPNEFYECPKGENMIQALHKQAAKSAMADNNMNHAWYHYRHAKDKEGLALVFDAILKSGNSNSYSELESIALSEPTLRTQRLKRIIDNTIESKKPVASAVKVYELYKKHNLKLTKPEQDALVEEVATEASRYDITRQLSGYGEVWLPWAKKHATDEPKVAYRIMAQRKYTGPEIITAVIAGLKVERYQNEERKLETKDVKKEHLAAAYEQADFNGKVQIAEALKDPEKLQSLSKAAYKKRDLLQAYTLWVSSGGSLENDYFNKIMTRLVRQEVKQGYGYMSFLDDRDKKGLEKAFDLMLTGKERSTARGAYEVALRLGDEKKTQLAREHMISVSPSFALREFSGTDKQDKSGIDLVLSRMSEAYGVDKTVLENVVSKYAPMKG